MLLKKYRDFTALFLGRLVSNCGDSIYTIVLSWYVLEMTNNAWYVGLLNFLVFIPNIFSFLFGQKIDALPKKQLLVWLELAQALAVLGIILGMSLRGISENFSLGLILVCVFLASTVGLNTYTVQDALVPRLVATKDLPKAQMYMSVAYNGTEYVFTALSGFLLSFFSYIPLLLLDVATFLTSVFCFRRIRFEEKIEERETEQDFFGGFRFIRQNKLVLTLTLGGVAANFLFAGLNVYQLLMARELGDSALYGLLVSASAIGTLLGTSLVANLFLKNLRVGQAYCLATLAFGLSIGSLALSQTSWNLLLAWFVSCLFLGVTHVAQKPILQAEVPKQM